MALLAFITLSVVTKAGPSVRRSGQRATKIQIVQLCATAHAEDTEQNLVGDEFETLIRQLIDAPRRRHPALPERWACQYDLGV